MISLVKASRRILEHGKKLRADLPSLVDNVVQNKGNASFEEALRNRTAPYLTEVARSSRNVSMVIAALAISTLALLTIHEKLVVLYYVLSAAVLIIWLTCSLVFSPLVGIATILRKLPEKLYRELLGIFWFNIDLLQVAVNLTLLCYLISSWSLTKLLPALAIILPLWLFGPWLIYLLRWYLGFFWIRVLQTVILICIASLTAVSPIPMRHYQAWARHRTADSLRPEIQKEITADWKSLQWFTQEGAPNVYSSGNLAKGFRLYSTPGYDPNTNERLRPIEDAASRDEIVAWFMSAEKDALMRQYLRSPESLTAKPPIALVTVATDPEKFSISVDRLASILNEAKVTTDTSIFTRAFSKSPLLQRLLAEQEQPLPFSISSYASKILVAETAEGPISEIAVEGSRMFACDLRYRAYIVLPDQRVDSSPRLTARGVGYNETAARASALDRAELGLAKTLQSLAEKHNATK